MMPTRSQLIRSRERAKGRRGVERGVGEDTHPCGGEDRRLLAAQRGDEHEQQRDQKCAKRDKADAVREVPVPEPAFERIARGLNEDVGIGEIAGQSADEPRRPWKPAAEGGLSGRGAKNNLRNNIHRNRQINRGMTERMHGAGIRVRRRPFNALLPCDAVADTITARAAWTWIGSSTSFGFPSGF
jgi:hypothetical protein